MRTCVLLVLLLFHGFCIADAKGAKSAGAPPYAVAYPVTDSHAAWRGLAASYIRKAERDQTLNRDPLLNARVDRVVAVVGAAVAAIDERFANATWRAILIERFGYGAVAFPGQTIIVDAHFVRALKLSDDELALLLSHEAAHIVADHSSAKLSFMAEFLGKDKIPTARTALLEFLGNDAYATAYRPLAMLQEREADTLGAAIFFATGYDTQRALLVFDKLAALETEDADTADSHDPAKLRKQSVSGVFAELQRATLGAEDAKDYSSPITSRMMSTSNTKPIPPLSR